MGTLNTLSNTSTRIKTLKVMFINTKEWIYLLISKKKKIKLQSYGADFNKLETLF